MKRRTVAAVLSALVVLPFVGLTLHAASSGKPDTSKKPAKPLHISRGAEVKLSDYVFPGRKTVFDFYSDYCPPCVQVAPTLEKLHQTRDDVVVVKVDINRPGMKGIDWRSPVARQYGLNSIPHFKVYGPDGKLMVEDDQTMKARRLVLSWVK